jgi:two-component system, chemotaxis family, CheB/CheR fusion protein
VAVVMIDASDAILSWNAAAESLFDVPTIGALGRKFRELDISYRIEGLRARIEDAKLSNVAHRLDEVSFPRRTGEMTTALVSVVPVMHPDRQGLASVVVSAFDTTELARLKEQMARVGEQHSTAIEELQSTNEELETMNEELQSTNEELETTNEELQSTNEELETTVEELQAANTELASLNAELDRRSAESKRAETYYDNVLNTLDSAVVIVDRHLVVTTWNRGAERLWGLGAAHVVGRVFTSLPGEVTQAAGSVMLRVITDGTPASVADMSYTLPGGEFRKASLGIVPLRDGVGEIIGAIAMLPDIVPAR